MKSVALAEIVFDAGTQIRAAINDDVVASYAECMTNGDVFPAVVLFHDGNHYYMADGFHRGLAAQRNGLTEIASDVRPGTKSDALWFALGANRANGQRMTDTDKRHAIELAYSAWPDKGQNEIAEQVGCSQRYVSMVRNEIQVRTGSNLPDLITGKDGKQYPASRGPNPKSTHKREEIAALVSRGVKPSEIASRVHASMTTVVDVRRSLGVPTIDKSRDGVAQRRKDIRDMAGRGFTTRQIASTVGITESAVFEIAKKESISIHADRAVGPTKRHDSTRIIEHIVMDAENLTTDINLIDFSSLDRERIGPWADALIASRRALDVFIRRLVKEKNSNGEAA